MSASCVGDLCFTQDCLRRHQLLCVETGHGQVAKLLGARAEVRLTRAFGSGKLGKKVVDVRVKKDLSYGDSKDG